MLDVRHAADAGGKSHDFGFDEKFLAVASQFGFNHVRRHQLAGPHMNQRCLDVEHMDQGTAFAPHGVQCESERAQ